MTLVSQGVPAVQTRKRPLDSPEGSRMLAAGTQLDLCVWHRTRPLMRVRAAEGTLRLARPLMQCARRHRRRLAPSGAAGIRFGSSQHVVLAILVELKAPL